jgi:hypothetical protein
VTILGLDCYFSFQGLGKRGGIIMSSFIPTLSESKELAEKAKNGAYHTAAFFLNPNRTYYLGALLSNKVYSAAMRIFQKPIQGEDAAYMYCAQKSNWDGIWGGDVDKIERAKKWNEVYKKVHKGEREG